IEVGLADAEHLRLPLEPPEGGAVQDAVAVALGGVPVVAAGRGRFVVLSLEEEGVHCAGLTSKFGLPSSWAVAGSSYGDGCTAQFALCPAWDSLGSLSHCWAHQ